MSARSQAVPSDLAGNYGKGKPRVSNREQESKQSRKVKTYPRLLEIGVEAVDNVLLVVGEPSDLLLLGKREDLLVEFSPKFDTTSSDFVNRFTEFRVDSHDSSRRLVVSLFPVVVSNSRCIDDQLLDGFRSVSLLRYHRPRSKEESIERHPRDTVLLRPNSRKVRVGTLGVSETGSSEKFDVGVLTDRGVGGEDRSVEIFARVVTSSTSSSPLEDNGEVRVRSSDVDNLTNTIDRSYVLAPCVSTAISTSR